MVRFKSDTHQYFKDQQELISVSSFVKQFELKKDWVKIAAKVAKKKNKTTKEILDLWEYKRQKGTEAGTIVHTIKENETLGNGLYNYDGYDLEIKECEHKEDFKYAIELEDLEPGYVYPELMIYDLDAMICGQSDEVVINKNKTIDILDFKTDKSIDFKAFSSDWVEPEKLKKPVSHLDNCNGNIYSLKMSMYMYLLWKATKGKYKPGKIILKWCPIERDADEIPILYDGVPKILFEQRIELPYRKKEVMAMIEHYKAKK